MHNRTKASASKSNSESNVNEEGLWMSKLRAKHRDERLEVGVERSSLKSLGPQSSLSLWFKVHLEHFVA